MNNPNNPFVPKVSMVEQKTRNRSRFKTAFFCVLAANIIPITVALLIQGCKKHEAEETNPPVDTNMVAPALTSTNIPELPPVTNTVPPPVDHTAMPPASVVTEYKVVQGDNFTTIGKKFGVTAKQIQDANPSVDPKKLQIGQKLTIPAPAAAVASTLPPGSLEMNASGDTMYTVKSGDTLTKIAEDHRTTVKAIRTANNLTTDRIIVGQKLKIPAKLPPPAAPPAPATPATPTPGQPITAPPGQ